MLGNYAYQGSDHHRSGGWLNLGAPTLAVGIGFDIVGIVALAIRADRRP
jgi:hypothetical protein